MINLKFVEQLLDLLNSTNAGSIEVRKNLFSTSIKVSKGKESGPSTVDTGPPSTVDRRPSTDADHATATQPPESAERPPADTKLHDIKSPMVGTFYAQPEPGAEPYVQPGSRIAPGQALCIIEAMKIMNTIDAEVSGVVMETCVQDAQPVEFGQVLFKVDTNG
jgi:acetyl-CoA carboxylase biotin carboxyl carrier protein